MAVKELANNFPQRLQDARKLRGLSMGELADRAGLDTSSISYYESGERQPLLSTLSRICNVLDVPVDAFFEVSTTPSNGPSPVASPTFRSRFGLLLMEARAGMTQREAAERCGMKQQTYCYYETHYSSPSLPTIWRLHEGLGIDLETTIHALYADYKERQA